MTKFRGLEEYMNRANAFVEFAVNKSTNKECIICPCKKCKFNKSLNPIDVTNEDEQAANGDHRGSSQSMCRSSFLCHLLVI
jgi:hypothetical protein